MLLELPVRLLVGLPVQSGPQVRLTFVDAHVAAGAVQFLCGDGAVHVGLQGKWVQALRRHHLERLQTEKGSGLVCRSEGERRWMDQQVTQITLEVFFLFCFVF